MAAKLSARDRQLAALLASGMTREEAGAQLKLSVSTVQRTMAKPGFAALVDSIRDEATEAGVDALRGLFSATVVRLGELVQSTNQMVALGGCRTVLEYLIRYREHAAGSRRLAELEREEDELS